MSNIFEDNNEFSPWEIKEIVKNIKKDVNIKKEKKLYWKMYQDKNSIKYRSVIITQEDMINEVNYWNNEGNEDEDAPVFEPIFMTEEEFNKLPEFKGF